jgi:ATP-dependent RNA helicase SUPV3L1/SUV3
LVATDAIGMGLNLKIKRVVFITITKQTSEFKKEQDLTDTEIKQIAGRAGRGYSEGFVQCTNSKILRRVINALKDVNVKLEEK